MIALPFAADEVLRDLRELVRRVPESDCLVWAGGRQRGTLPMYRRGRVNMSARRLLVGLLRGQAVSSRFKVTTTCDTPCCVFEGHLVVVEHGAFIRRLATAGKLPTGVMRSMAIAKGMAPRARLGIAHARDVARMRADGADYKTIGARYGVTTAAAHAAMRRWRAMGVVQ